MRRVGFLLQNLGIGGAERQAVDLAHGLPARGWEPVFLLAEDDGPLRAEVRALGLPLHDLGARHWIAKHDPRFWINLAGVVARTCAIARRERLEVLHSFLFWQDPIAVAAARLCSRAAVTSRFAQASFTLHRPHYRAINNAMNALADAVVCNSRGVRRDALRNERLDPRKATVIPNGVRAEAFAGVAPVRVAELFPPLGDAAPLVGMMATLRAVKRHDVFLRALAMARREHPRMKAVLVGRDDGAQAHLERLVRELRLEDAVAFAGATTQPAAWYAALDAFVLASDTEGFPNAVLEAMASGLPVVSTRVPGAEDAVADGRTGYLVPRRDPARMASALCAIAEDPQAATRMGERGRERVRRLFTPDACARRHAALYERLAGGAT